MTAKLAVPAGDAPKLAMDVASFADGDWVLKVFVNDQLVKEALIMTEGKWRREVIDAGSWAGTTAAVRVEVHANNWHWERAFFGRIGFE